MKSVALALPVLLFATAAWSQEPVNHAVVQPTVNQPAALQPGVINISSVVQLVPPQPEVPYLSEPVIRPPQQPPILPKPPLTIKAPRMPENHQPTVCGCNTR